MSDEIEAIARTIADVEGSKNWQRYIPHAKAAVHQTLNHLTAALIESEHSVYRGVQPISKNTAHELLSILEQMKRPN